MQIGQVSCKAAHPPNINFVILYCHSDFTQNLKQTHLCGQYKKAPVVDKIKIMQRTDFVFLMESVLFLVEFYHYYRNLCTDL